MVDRYLKRCCRAVRLHTFLSIFCPIAGGIFLGQYASIARGSLIQTYLITLCAIAVITYLVYAILDWSEANVCETYIQYVKARRRWMKRVIDKVGTHK